MDSSARYQYEPLGSPSSIRSVVVYPRADNVIRVDLESFDLLVDIIPKYEALSYTWGDPDDRLDIVIGDERRLLSVTRNLHEALQQLAAETTTRRIFWIDAISINQQDLNERSFQVKLMTEIYRKADRVLVWLGPTSPGCSRAMLAIKSLGENIDYNPITVKFTSRSAVPMQRQREELFTNHPTLVRDLAELLSRPWFQRLWVWQEIRSANDQSIVKCGDHDTTWTDFHKAALAFEKDWKLPRVVASRLRVVDRMKKSQWDSNLASLTLSTRHTRCSDLRDRLFAVRGLLQHSEASLIEPDYNRSVKDVFPEVAEEYISTLRSLQLLSDDYGVLFGIRRIVAHLQLDTAYPSGGSLFQALALTLVGGDVAENFHPIPDLIDIRSAELDLQRFIANEEGNDALEWTARVRDRYASIISNVLKGCCFFTTEEGYIGASPGELQPRDTVNLFLGANRLTALRKTNGGQCHILADCYIQGLMHGEGLFGPVPDGYRRVIRAHDTTRERYPCWKLEGPEGPSFQTQDPRLWPLSDGWRIKHHEDEEYFDCYENTITGDELDDLLNYDPRLRSEELGKRGIHLTTFDIV